ncbi:hypothetical protein JG688_00009462 [Phytophthora aleatoria]|uniref:Uncharacterized protein n=1 Tax=Phytophthora aleatoria TaxID=2496075 RepID=A0A8J5M406_9STRA|nr:hypothetical protein JG688_00009462 [Phytophthora aleatoria]
MKNDQDGTRPRTRDMCMPIRSFRKFNLCRHWQCMLGFLDSPILRYYRAATNMKDFQKY